MFTASLKIKGDSNMLLLVAAVLVGCWLLGLVFRIAGGFIHILLIIAVVVVILSLLGGHSGHP
jgi:hypothetical protein